MQADQTFEASVALPSNVRVYSARMRIPAWAKQSSLTVVAFVTALAWFSIYHVPAVIDSQTKGMSNDISGLKADMGSVKTGVQRIDTTVNGMMKELLDAQLASLKEIKKQNTETVKDKLAFVASIVSKAQQAGIVADSGIVTDAGTSVLELAKNSKLRMAAWDVTSKLIDYRSFLNSRHPPDTSGATQVQNPTDFWVRYMAREIPGATISRQVLYISRDFVPAPEAAIFTNIGRENRSSRAPRFLVLDAPGTEIRLDGQHLKNVIIRDAAIVYEGGSVLLDNVRFLNCTFIIARTQHGQQLATDILSGPQTTSNIRA